MTALSDARRVFTSRRDVPWVKLCGARDSDTARMLAALRPDAIGFNFFERSVRYISTSVAAEACRTLPDDVMAIGVFVNESADSLLSMIDACGLAGVQLHGDEPPSLVAAIRQARPELAIVRAWRVGADGLSPLAAYLAECSRLGVLPDAVLVDAHVAGSYGGTGKTAPWERLREYDAAWPPLILAGGLVAENVSEAIDVVRPFGVDTAGGIESSPGVKDPTRAAAFIAALKHAAKNYPFPSPGSRSAPRRKRL